MKNNLTNDKEAVKDLYLAIEIFIDLQNYFYFKKNFVIYSLIGNLINFTETVAKLLTETKN